MKQLKKVKLSSLKSGPIRHSTLPKDLVDRIARIRDTLNEFQDPSSSLEEWLEDFKRDVHPEKEVRIWEQIASFFEVFRSTRVLSHEASKEAVAVLLGWSVGVATSSTKHLTKQDVRELLAGARGQTLN